MIMASIPDRQWSSIGVEKAMFNELKTLKVQAEERAGRRLTWADFFAILMGLHEMRSVAIPAEQVPVAHMHQEKPGEEPLSPEQLEEMGLEEISLPQREGPGIHRRQGGRKGHPVSQGVLAHTAGGIIERADTGG